MALTRPGLQCQTENIFRSFYNLSLTRAVCRPEIAATYNKCNLMRLLHEVVEKVSTRYTSGRRWNWLWPLVLALPISFSVILGSATPARVLIYSRTVGFRHDSIPTAIESLKSNTSTDNIIFDQTEDPGQFTDENLQKYDALLFLSTTGEVLDSGGKTAFQNYLNKGGNFVAVHSASDCLRNTTAYGRELGSYFDYHAELQNAIVDVIPPNHPSTSKLPSAWMVRDEMYNFVSDPRSLGAVVVLAANESSYVDNGTRKFNQGSPHPIAWYQEHGAGTESDGIVGRSFYTSLGHLNETWQDDLFLSHVMGGINWALQSNTTSVFNSSGLVGNSNSSGSQSTNAPSITSQSPIQMQTSGAHVLNTSPALIKLAPIAMALHKLFD